MSQIAGNRALPPVANTMKLFKYRAIFHLPCSQKYYQIHYAFTQRPMYFLFTNNLHDLSLRKFNCMGRHRHCKRGHAEQLQQLQRHQPERRRRHRLVTAGRPRFLAAPSPRRTSTPRSTTKRPPMLQKAGTTCPTLPTLNTLFNLGTTKTNSAHSYILVSQYFKVFRALSGWLKIVRIAT